jgi:hypothetical protein
MYKFLIAPIKLLCLVAFLIMLVPQWSYANFDEITVQVDEKTIQFDTEKPIIKNGVILLPAYAIFKELGVNKLEDTGIYKISGYKDGFLIDIFVVINTVSDGAIHCKKENGKDNCSSSLIDINSQTGEIINNKPYVTLDAISAAFHVKTKWDSINKKASISTTEMVGFKPINIFLSDKTYFYDNPNDSNAVGSLSSQKVVAVDGKNGWFKILTYLGEKWVNIDGVTKTENQDTVKAEIRPQEESKKQIYIPETTYLYANPADTEAVSNLSPQILSVIDETDNWYKISTWLGGEWIPKSASIVGRTLWANHPDSAFSNLEELMVVDVKMIDDYTIDIYFQRENGETVNKQTKTYDITSKYYFENPFKMHNWSDKVWGAIKSGDIYYGMTSDQVRMALASPSRINFSSNQYGTHEQWVYDYYVNVTAYESKKYMTKYLFFDNDVFTGQSITN